MIGSAKISRATAAKAAPRTPPTKPITAPSVRTMPPSLPLLTPSEARMPNSSVRSLMVMVKTDINAATTRTSITTSRTVL